MSPSAFDLPPAEGVRPALSVSIVLFFPDPQLLAATLASLERACRHAGLAPRLVLVDNGGSGPVLERLALPEGWTCTVLTGHGNPGFGGGHNLCLDQLLDVHLILNPDVELAPDALSHALAFLEAHPECGLVAPAARWDDGQVQYLCKRRPSVLDLFLRGFAPAWLRQRSQARLARYEMRDRIGDAVCWDPPIASGCCMFLRGPLLRRLGGFDPGFFLYFEDFDLSLRLARFARIAYVPTVKIVHHGGHAARKGARHIYLFGRSAWRFFQLHGWRWT